jgi:hypothetical protein
MTQIMMATVLHLTAWAGRTKYHADGFLFNRVYIHLNGINLKNVSYNLKQTQPCVLLKNKTKHSVNYIKKAK